MYEYYYNKWRDFDLLTCILSILGLVVGIVDVRRFNLISNTERIPFNFVSIKVYRSVS
jgi:hypothetical protein